MYRHDDFKKICTREFSSNLSLRLNAFKVTKKVLSLHLSGTIIPPSRLHIRILVHVVA